MQMDLLLVTETHEEAVECRQDFVQFALGKGMYPVKRDGHITLPSIHMMVGIYAQDTIDQCPNLECDRVESYEELCEMVEKVV